MGVPWQQTNRLYRMLLLEPITPYPICPLYVYVSFLYPQVWLLKNGVLERQFCWKGVKEVRKCDLFNLEMVCLLVSDWNTTVNS